MTEPCSLQWSDIGCADGPALKDHAGFILGNCLYVHGGQTARRDSMTEARQGLYRIRLSPSVGTWTDLTTSDSPSLSQHACLSMEDRYLVFIGGWTGKTRIPGVHTYDTVSQKWLPPALNEPLLKGFPSGAGLSAHSATKMQPHPAGLGSFTSLIIGREGSLRTQRKAGNIYLLYGNVRGSGSDNMKAHYTYCEANSQLATSSRSYHTSFAASPNTLVTVGGRKDHVIELLRWKSSSKNSHSLDWPGTLVYPPDTCTVVTDLIKQVHQKKLKLSEAVIKNQCGWRGHSAVPGLGGTFICGGEGFNALVRDPLDHAYLYLQTSADTRGYLYDLGKMNQARSYAVMAINANDHTAWLHGGLGPGGRVQNSLLCLAPSGKSDQ